MDICSVCGTPRVLGQKCVWLPDGTIRMKEDPSMRAFFADCLELSHLFEELGSQLGIGTSAYLQEGARSFSRRYMSLFLRFIQQDEGPLFGEGQVFRILLEHLRIWGLGASQTLPSAQEGILRLELRGAADDDLVCGYLSGAAEVITGCMISCNLLRGGDKLVVELISGESAPIGEMPAPEPEFGEAKGVIGYSTCPECGVPLQVSRLNWDVEAGAITDLVTGRRLAFVGSEVIGEALRNLTEELGEHVLSRVVEIEREYARDVLYPLLRVSKDPHEMRALFGSMGHGDITAEGEDRPAFRIRRPCQPHLMAGRILGFYEGWRGERVAASWRISEWGTAYVSIHN